MSVLMHAVKWNSTPQVIAVLLKAGANINSQDKNGMTALMYASLPEVVLTLLKAGADAKVRNSRGDTAFDLVRSSSLLKDTEAYRQLEEATRQDGSLGGLRPRGQALSILTHKFSEGAFICNFPVKHE
jgi:ankyrin repeat protein